jgi:hypothetical protein
VIFGLAKILRSKKFGQTNDPRVFFRRITNEFDSARKIPLRFRATFHLHKRNFCCVRFSH